ncbi:hypothetical protein QJQ45_009814 [Haematococcus lacustris]|nr:hypothetical protein QJQ45_009814 [Haematococcus lacustris]
MKRDWCCVTATTKTAAAPHCDIAPGKVFAGLHARRLAGSGLHSYTLPEPGPEVVSTPLSAKTAAKWLKDGGTGVVALVSYENLQDPPGVPPEQAAQLKSLLMEFSDVFEPITGQQKRRLQEGDDVGAGTPLGSGSGGSEQQPTAGSDPDHDADSDDALKPSEPKRLSTAYHPQSDGQTERTNQIVEEMLRHYILPTQEDWPRHLAFAEFAINNSWQESIQSTPFLVNYGQSPITPVLHKLPRPCLSPSAESFAKKWEHEVKHAQECMRVAQDRQQRYANKRRRDVTFSVGDSVLLSTKNLRNAPGRARKFLPRYVGPFKVTGKLGEAAYRLELPPTMSRLHPVFHVSLLKKYTGSQGFHPPPVMEWLEDAPHYEVHSLLSHRQVRFKKRMEYLVKWTGYDDTYNTWEPEAMLAGAPQILSSAGANGYCAGANSHSAGANGHSAKANGYSAGANGHSARANGHSAGANGHSAEANGYCAGAIGFSAEANGYCADANGSSASDIPVEPSPPLKPHDYIAGARTSVEAQPLTMHQR